MYKPWKSFINSSGLWPPLPLLQPPEWYHSLLVTLVRLSRAAERSVVSKRGFFCFVFFTALLHSSTHQLGNIQYPAYIGPITPQICMFYTSLNTDHSAWFHQARVDPASLCLVLSYTYMLYYCLYIYVGWGEYVLHTLFLSGPAVGWVMSTLPVLFTLLFTWLCTLSPVRPTTAVRMLRTTTVAVTDNV